MDFDSFKIMVAEGLGIDARVLTREISLRDDLGIDSLSVINFLVKVERKFKLKFDVESIGTMKNLGEIHARFRDALIEEKACLSSR